MFTTFDKDNRSVTLTGEVWFNKILNLMRGHPEVKEYIQEIQSTINSPDFIYQSSRDKRSKLFYKKGLTKGKYKDCYILVVVKYVEEEGGMHGYVSTIMLTDHVKKRGGLLWKR